MAAFVLAACAEPYDPPQVFDEQFAAGTSTEQPARGFGGLDDIVQNDPRVVASGQAVRVLWTHGMCTPEKPGPYGAWWQVRMRDLMAAYPGAVADTASITQALPGGAKLIKTGAHSPGGRAIELWFLDWTPITQPYKLIGDNDPESPKGNPYRYSRATVNASLKQGLMKNCLPEVVVYLGSNGDVIRSDTQLALCEFFGGSFDTSTGCVGASDTRPTMMIAESIGSSILFDAFRALRSDIAMQRYNEAEQAVAGNARRNASKSERAAMAAANTASERARANGAGVGKAMGSLSTIFMLANQIPLINLANRTETGGQERFDEFMSSAAELRPAGAPPLTVVAFVDPNDLLSFRLVPRSDRARVINFVVSNADTYAGYFERPDVAHCNYVRNGYVMHAIVYGYAGGPPQSGKVDDPDPCL
jgi:hypothetical protein